MTYEHLLEQAADLTAPDKDAAAEFAREHDALASALNEAMGARPDLDRLIGPDNRAMMEDNSRNFCRFMKTLFHAYEPRVFVETVLWVFRTYRAHGFLTAYWAANLDTFAGLARERLSKPTYAGIYPFIEWLIVNIPVFTAITDAQLDMSPVAGEAPSHD